MTGVDSEPQPDYAGDEFVQGDAIEYLLAHGAKFNAVNASPPCQHDHPLTHGSNRGRGFSYPDLVLPTRDALMATGRPYVIEQPPGKASQKIRVDITLCGEMFDLSTLRHRNFELGGWDMPQPPHPAHRGYVRGWRHGVYRDGPYVAVYGKGGGKASLAEAQLALGIDWTANFRGLCEAIPPAYTACIGAALWAHLRQTCLRDLLADDLA